MSDHEWTPPAISATVYAHITPDVVVNYSLRRSDSGEPYIVFKLDGDGQDITLFIHDAALISRVLDFLESAHIELWDAQHEERYLEARGDAA